VSNIASRDSHLFVERVRCFIKWHENRFDALDKPHEPISNPVGWTRRAEVWIKQAVWRDTIFDGDGDEAMSASCALRDLGLLRVQDRGNCAALVNIRGKPCRAYVVLPTISEWRPVTGAHNGNNGYAQLEPDRPPISLIPAIPASPPDLASKLEAATSLALDEALAILRLEAQIDDRTFQMVVRAKAGIINTVLNSQVRVDEARLRHQQHVDGLPALLERIAAVLKVPDPS
jgi:hypothetical protein